MQKVCRDFRSTLAQVCALGSALMERVAALVPFVALTSDVFFMCVRVCSCVHVCRWSVWGQAPRLHESLLLDEPETLSQKEKEYAVRGEC